MNRFDGASADYKQSKMCDKILLWIFWINVCVCLLSLFFRNNTIVSIIQIILPVLYILLSLLGDHFLWYPAEQKRRKLWFSDGFQRPFCPETTSGYYNNDISGSFIRLAVNAFESVFFTVRVAKKMFLPSAIKGIVSFLVFIGIIICFCACHLNYGFLILSSQTLFSGMIMAGFVKRIIFYCRVKNIHDSFFKQFVTEGILRKEQLPTVLENMVEYECLKSFYQIRLSQKIFDDLNATCSNEWSEIFKKIQISQAIEKVVCICN